MKLKPPYNNFVVKKETDRHWFITCPFHLHDTDASLCINKPHTPYPLYYKCFACGEWGSPQTFAEAMGVKFVMYVENKAKNIAPKVEIDWDNLDLKDVGVHLMALALCFEVKVDSIMYYGVQWHEHERCYYIPMFNGSKKCGYQRRYSNGEKKTVKHSKQGFFIPNHKFYLNKPLFICEGFSDACVITDLGFQAIGRYNASHIKMPKGVLKFKKVYIMTDTDECGVMGTMKIRDTIPTSVILTPRTLSGVTQHYYRDIRQMVHSEGQAATKDWLIKNIGI